MIETGQNASFISSAHAQSPKTSDPPPIIPEYEQLRGQGAVIDANPGLMGFDLEGRMEEVLEGCENLTAPYYLGAFALADINDEDYYLKINSCLKTETKGKSHLLRFGAVQAPLTLSEKEIVEDIWKALKKRDSLLDLVSEDLLNKDFKDRKNLTYFSKTIDSLDEWDHVISIAGRMFIYAGLKNFGKVDELAKRYLEAPKVFNYYEIEYPFRNAKEKAETLAKLLGSIKDKISSSKLYDAFLLKLYEAASPIEKDLLEDELDLPLSGSKIRKLINSPVLGDETSLAWGGWARENLSASEANKAYEKVPVSTKPHNLAVLRHYTPMTQDRRDGMARAFGELLESTDSKKISLAVEIMENDSWKKFLSSKKETRSPPIFKLKRRVFTQNIKNNKAILFSVYNLFKLGDFKREHFVKILALRSYGLPATFLLPIQ